MNNQIIFTILLVSIMSIIVQPIIWSLDEEDKILKKNCYDKFSNKIEGLICEKEIIGVPFKMKIFLSLFAIIFSIVFGLIAFREYEL